MRRSAPYSLIAAVSAFCCRLAEYSLPTTSAAVACPPLTEAATRKREELREALHARAQVLEESRAEPRERAADVASDGRSGLSAVPV